MQTPSYIDPDLTPDELAEILAEPTPSVREILQRIVTSYEVNHRSPNIFCSEMDQLIPEIYDALHRGCN